MAALILLSFLMAPPHWQVSPGFWLGVLVWFGVPWWCGAAWGEAIIEWRRRRWLRENLKALWDTPPTYSTFEGLAERQEGEIQNYCRSPVLDRLDVAMQDQP